MSSMPEASPEEREVLKLIARIGGLHDTVYTSSGELAERLDVSQQTASRKILDLLDEGYITRRMGTRKQHLRLSPKGVNVLRREYAEYKAIFEEGSLLTIRGKVVSGLGEGEYYISREGYRKQFNRIFGFDPYPGTLNVEVDPVDREKLQELQEMEGTVIPEFESEGRTFGAVKCFEAEVHAGRSGNSPRSGGAAGPEAGAEPKAGGASRSASEGGGAEPKAGAASRSASEPEAGAVGADEGGPGGSEGGGADAGAILPVRSHHSNVLEVISPVYLRDELGLEDDARVTVRVDLRARDGV